MAITKIQAQRAQQGMQFNQAQVPQTQVITLPVQAQQGSAPQGPVRIIVTKQDQSLIERLDRITVEVLTIIGGAVLASVFGRKAALAFRNRNGHVPAVKETSKEVEANTSNHSLKLPEGANQILSRLKKEVQDVQASL